MRISNCAVWWRIFAVALLLWGAHPRSAAAPAGAVRVACRADDPGDAGPPVPGTDVPPEVDGDAVVLRSGDEWLPISLGCPRLDVDGAWVGKGARRLAIEGDVASGRPVECRYEPIPLPGGGSLEVRLFVQWMPRAPLLRKWAQLRLDATAPKLLREVVLEEIDVPSHRARMHAGGTQSYPVFLDGFLAGIAFPIAATRQEGERVLLAHRPGRRLKPGEWVETRTAIFAPAPLGREREAFQRYVSRHRPKPAGLHVNYNSWWSIPAPYTEADVLKLMRAFEKKLTRPYGVSLDTFCIDMGWSDLKSVWEIDRKLFPEGFAGIQAAAERMGSRLGLWISPSSCYPGAVDNEAAARDGYEIFPGWNNQRLACLGGDRYRTRFQERLVDMVTRYDIGHLKFDGYSFVCTEAGHGHEPGALSAEALADGILTAIAAIRKAQPDVWIESTCFGWNPSPWWLFHVNSVIGTFGDDAPYGRVPAPVYRESYTTARDYFNLQGAHYLPIPAQAQEVLGVIHQTTEPFLNDAVTTVLRGHAFLPLYLNPAYLRDQDWRALAGLLKWARRNAPALRETTPILPESWRRDGCPRFTGAPPMPREPYGYAHWGEERSLVLLRNPWIAPCTVPLMVERPAGAGPLTVVSLYPEARLYGEGVAPGSTLGVPLAPYETVVLSIEGRPAPRRLPQAGELPKDATRAEVTRSEIRRVRFEGPEPLGPDWTCPTGDPEEAVRVSLEGTVDARTPDTRLLILIERKTPVPIPHCTLRVDGKAAPVTPRLSEAGWAATGAQRPEHWAFLDASLPKGRHHLSLEAFAGGDDARLSAWVWSSDRPGGSRVPNALPHPETVSRGAVRLLPATDLSAVPPEVLSIQRRVEKIDGVFLDALEPASVQQGWGKLQRNQSVWEKPMSIAGRRFVRGIGTHAPARIRYALDGKYRRFQAWAGADGATGPTITLEVWVDGKRRWESGLMRREDAARRVDVSVAGAKTLELVVGDAGNGIAADHADWADARLLRVDSKPR